MIVSLGERRSGMLERIKEEWEFKGAYRSGYLLGIIEGRISANKSYLKKYRKIKNDTLIKALIKDDDLIDFIDKYGNQNTEIIAKHYAAETEYYPF